MRIAFVTDEFVTEIPTGGGLGAYLDRMTAALRDGGHDVEVITRSLGEPSIIDYHGIRVQSVRDVRGGVLRALGVLGRLHRGLLLPVTHASLDTATALGRAFESRHRQAPFDFVQSASTGLSGLFIPRGVRHVMRMSGARDLWTRTDRVLEDESAADYALFGRLERWCMRRADVVYAPSAYLAHYFHQTHGRQVEVLRPPIVESLEIGEVPPGLPPRYLVHFGTLMRRKGTDVVADALSRAWRREPELTMVWAGRPFPQDSLEVYRRAWGTHADRVHYVGALRRPQLHAVLRGAIASVLPSRVDNLPNTVIESLVLGVGVIGSEGASIDELVEPGRNGELVGVGDADALAAAMVRAWRGEGAWLGGGFSPPRVFAQMQPSVAAKRLLTLAVGRT